VKAAIHRAAILLMLVVQSASAEEMPAVLAEGTPVLTEKNKWILNVQSNGASLLTYDRPAISARPIVQCKISELASKALWRTSCDMPFTNAFASGEVVLITGRARTLETTNTTGRGTLRSIFRFNEPPYKMNFAVRFEAGKEWQRFFFPATLDFDIPAKKGVLIFNLGYSVQMVELCDVQIYRFPSAFDVTRLPKTDFTRVKM
jgi:hypothetical protein